MKTKQEIIEFLKECVNEYGMLDLSDIDTTSFAESVNISHMKVKGTLFQHYQQVGCTLFQHYQQVGRDLFQQDQQVQGALDQHSQQVGGVLFSHKLRKGEKWKSRRGYVERVKKGE